MTPSLKAENVSTNEVGEIINGFDQVKFCNVYGVEIPSTDGRAGMAALTLQDGVETLDLARFAEYVSICPVTPYRCSCAYNQIDVTGTFKMLKGDLRKQGYDINMTDDPIFVMKSGESTYSPMDSDYLTLIRESQDFQCSDHPKFSIRERQLRAGKAAYLDIATNDNAVSVKLAFSYRTGLWKPPHLYATLRGNPTDPLILKFRWLER